VSEVSVAHLAKLAGLKTLAIGQTGISEQGAARLRAALPRCKIMRE